MVAQVIVDVVHTNVARPFSYLVPEGAEVSYITSPTLMTAAKDHCVQELI